MLSLILFLCACSFYYCCLSCDSFNVCVAVMFFLLGLLRTTKASPTAVIEPLRRLTGVGAWGDATASTICIGQDKTIKKTTRQDGTEQEWGGRAQARGIIEFHMVAPHPEVLTNYPLMFTRRAETHSRH